MQGVDVTATGQPNGVTDSQGNWDFGDVPPGSYTVTGLLDANSTVASQTLSAPAGTSTMFNLVLCAIKLQIQINNTGATNDDVVQVKCDHPSHRHKVPCQIKLAGGAAHDHQITLGNPDGRLRFPEAGDTTKTVTLPVSGAWVAFEISGETASSAKGDAVIEARLAAACPDGGASSVGDLKGTQPATVFSFNPAQMTLTQGGNYSLVGTTYGPVGGPGASFSAQATLKPAGLDCSVPQIKNLQIGIMQESSNFQSTVTWSNPTPGWHAGVAAGTSVTVPMTMRQTTAYAPAVVQPVADTTHLVTPLYDRPGVVDPTGGGEGTISPDSLKPPIGCASGAPATSSDSPDDQNVSATFSQDFPSPGPAVVTVTWTFVNATRVEHFRTFCVVFNTVTKSYCVLRQATWDLNVDSAGPAADQHATVHPDAPASADPATGMAANDAPQPSVTAPVGAATKTFTR